jgi:hypothetical protein
LSAGVVVTPRVLETTDVVTILFFELENRRAESLWPLDLRAERIRGGFRRRHANVPRIEIAAGEKQVTMAMSATSRPAELPSSAELMLAPRSGESFLLERGELDPV